MPLPGFHRIFSTTSRVRDWILSLGMDPESGTGSWVRERTINLDLTTVPALLFYNGDKKALWGPAQAAGQ